jgi:hypothetical protein
MTLESLVRNKLEVDEDLRSDDIKLIVAIWEKEGLQLTEDQRKMLAKVHSPESIRRTRQKLQERGMCLPSAAVQKKRKALADRVRQEIREEKLPILFTMPAPKTCIDPFTNS